MKLRLLILLAGLLVVGTPSISEACGYGSFGSAKNISNPDIAQYKLLCDYGSCGLAMDNDGAWGAGCGYSKEVASSSSIGECQKHSKNPDSCKVVDIDGKSDFIKEYLGQDKPGQNLLLCYDLFYGENIRLGPYLYRDWAHIVEQANGGTNIKPEAAAAVQECSGFLSDDYLTWIGPEVDRPFPDPTPIPEPDPAPKSKPTPVPSSKYRLVGTGTGFVVNPNYIVTADHVLRRNKRGDTCNALSIVFRKDDYEARIVDLDPANDLGLIKLGKPIESSAILRAAPDLRLGETAINYGYPLTGTLSTSAKITSGSVNSLAGYNNNSAFIQYDAATQRGNSGGPVMDASGDVIGVVRSGLDNAETQLVNFATKSTILEGFLKANKVPFEKADLTEELKLPDIAEKAEGFTVLVGCWE